MKIKTQKMKKKRFLQSWKNVFLKINKIIIKKNMKNKWNKKKYRNKVRSINIVIYINKVNKYIINIVEVWNIRNKVVKIM